MMKRARQQTLDEAWEPHPRRPAVPELPTELWVREIMARLTQPDIGGTSTDVLALATTCRRLYTAPDDWRRVACRRMVIGKRRERPDEVADGDWHTKTSWQTPWRLESRTAQVMWDTLYAPHVQELVYHLPCHHGWDPLSLEACTQLRRLVLCGNECYPNDWNTPLPRALTFLDLKKRYRVSNIRCTCSLEHVSDDLRARDPDHIWYRVLPSPRVLLSLGAEENDDPIVRAIKASLYSRVHPRQSFILLPPHMEYAETLVRRGAVAMPFLMPADLENMHERFEETLRTFPEYAHPARADTRYVLGGFGALGNAASFHNPLVRELRWRAHENVHELFSFLHAAGETRLTNDHRVHVIVDRMRVLTHDAAIGVETWHRDRTPAHLTLPDDLIFGGWINLDLTRTQYLSAIPGSHRDPGVTTAGNGFERVDTDAAKARHDALPAADRAIAVPPGHLLVFYQELLHQVLPRHPISARKLAANPGLRQSEYRLFTGWRLTRDTQPLRPTLPTNFFVEMAVPALKSGQPVRLYPKNYYEFGAVGGVQALAAWSQATFPDALCTRRITRDRTYTVMPAVCPSLADCCARLGTHVPYPLYEERERAIYSPHTSFCMFNMSPDMPARFQLGPHV